MSQTDSRMRRTKILWTADQPVTLFMFLSMKKYTSAEFLKISPSKISTAVVTLDMNKRLTSPKSFASIFLVHNNIIASSNI